MITFNFVSRVIYDGIDGAEFMEGDWKVAPNKMYVEGFCLEDDTKPVSTDAPWIANGSKLTEIDTTDVYLFNEEDNEWVKFAVIEDNTNNGGGEE